MNIVLSNLSLCSSVRLFVASTAIFAALLFRYPKYLLICSKKHLICILEPLKRDRDTLCSIFLAICCFLLSVGFHKLDQQCEERSLCSFQVILRWWTSLTLIMRRSANEHPVESFFAFSRRSLVLILLYLLWYIE